MRGGDVLEGLWSTELRWLRGGVIAIGETMGVACWRARVSGHAVREVVLFQTGSLRQVAAFLGGNVLEDEGETEVFAFGGGAGVG